MCETLQSIDELKTLINKIDSNSQILYRGQNENYPVVPSATRPFLQRGELWIKDFNCFAQEFLSIHSKIEHLHIVRTFKDIFFELYPNYRKLDNMEKCNGFDNNEALNFILQCLRQQYSRNALFLDVSSNLDVALFFGAHSFNVANGNSDGRMALRGTLSNNEWVYLSVFFIQDSEIIRFNTVPLEFFSSVAKVREQESEQPLLFAIDCSNVNEAQRLVNQSSWFLSKLPVDKFSHEIGIYNFDEDFSRRIFRIRRSVVLEYLNKTTNISINGLSLFPENDRVLNWVVQNRQERLLAIQNSSLTTNDLGISIYQYFPEIDKLYLTI